MKRKASEASNGDGSTRATEFAAHLQSLNKQFAGWVRQQAAEHGSELWTDGVAAYARFAEELIKEYEDVLQESGEGPAKKASNTAAALGFAGASTSTPNSTPPASGAFTFGATTAAAPAFTFGSASAAATTSSTPAAASSGGFTFGAASAAPAFGSTPSSSSATPLFGGTSGALAAAGASTPATPGASTPTMFSFGNTNATAGHTPAPPKFSFGGALTPSLSPSPSPAPAAGGFSFPQPAANGSAAGGSGADAAAGAEVEEGAKSYTPEISVDEETFEVLYNSKSKLLVLKRKDGEAAVWDGRGVGLLSIRRFKQGPNKKPHIFFTTEAGKALVMSPIIDSTRCILAPASAPEAAKKRVSLSLMVRDDELPPAGDKDAPAATEPKWSYQNCQFVLGSADKVADFVAQVDKYKPS